MTDDKRLFDRLPDDHHHDEVRIATVPRYKRSGLSGDEWRTSVQVTVLRKGRVLLGLAGRGARRRGRGPVSATEARCTLTPGCEHGPHEPWEHPCGQGVEPPGTPCRYCADLVPLDGSACPNCWESLSGKSLPELKGIFAELGLSVDTPERAP